MDKDAWINALRQGPKQRWRTSNIMAVCNPNSPDPRYYKACWLLSLKFPEAFTNFMHLFLDCKEEDHKQMPKEEWIKKHIKTDQIGINYYVETGSVMHRHHVNIVLSFEHTTKLHLRQEGFQLFFAEGLTNILGTFIDPSSIYVHFTAAKGGINNLVRYASKDYHKVDFENLFTDFDVKSWLDKDVDFNAFINQIK